MSDDIAFFTYAGEQKNAPQAAVCMRRGTLLRQVMRGAVVP
ncbi:hypothetical protein HMPREF0201_02994 [Cedecea davisae DSM 4568]|uniref:Uncharacterized protein n=1 Tax=Cedecea davisae DSM 4568 TaxID=566551 RepID=S3JRI8_9ENTR|nr:hypothetical protein HMPREF0201_02994 [Cedecea davisae DSM 4568]